VERVLDKQRQCSIGQHNSIINMVTYKLVRLLLNKLIYSADTKLKFTVLR